VNQIAFRAVSCLSFTSLANIDQGRIGGTRSISEFPNFRLTAGANQHYGDSVPSLRGALRNVINVGRDAVDVGSARDERGLLAYGQVVSF
jgi:hypothetical protein